MRHTLQCPTANTQYRRSKLADGAARSCHILPAWTWQNLLGQARALQPDHQGLLRPPLFEAGGSGGSGGYNRGYGGIPQSLLLLLQEGLVLTGLLQLLAALELLVVLGGGSGGVGGLGGGVQGLAGMAALRVGAACGDRLMAPVLVQPAAVLSSAKKGYSTDTRQLYCTCGVFVRMWTRDLDACGDRLRAPVLVQPAAVLTSPHQPGWLELV